ncbi:MAG: CRISPR-associated endonuclease Cas2 [Spirochaetia bacterium]|jgi:CRISPR-associated protein Cas2|nr:CRISPR-associated endonuclease Cas2 [Spirochaetia bacterium]
MIYFCCYDITDARRLKKVAKTLEKWGVRVQRSFFCCEEDSDAIQALSAEIIAQIDQKVDKFCVYPICDACFKKIVYFGCDASFIMPEYMIL